MKRVAFVIESFDWLGGLNYYRSLISAAADLSNRELEIIVFVPSTASASNVANFGGAQVVRSQWLDKAGAAALFRRSLRKLSFGWDMVLSMLLRRYDVDVLSHYAGRVPRGRHLRRIGWIPDFQYLHLPQYFGSVDVRARERATSEVVAQSDIVVLSSHAAEQDLKSIVGVAPTSVRVLHFVPRVERLDGGPASAEAIKEKYGIPADYIFLPNQFWVHKNHHTVVEALAKAKRAGRPVTIVASGSTDDYRSPGHFPQLRQLIDKLGVGDVFRIVGVIPYADLVALMTHARAVLNPSYFEGWSTTVEEAKALGKTVVLSDIPVHREQNPDDALYFDPSDPAMLEAALTTVMNRAPEVLPPTEASTRAYHASRLAFGTAYQRIVLEAADLNKVGRP